MHQTRSIIVALLLAALTAAGALLASSAPSSAPSLATDADGGAAPDSGTDDSRPSPTIPLPPPAGALASR